MIGNNILGDFWSWWLSRALLNVCPTFSPQVSHSKTVGNWTESTWTLTSCPSPHTFHLFQNMANPHHPPWLQLFSQSTLQRSPGGGQWRRMGISQNFLSYCVVRGEGCGTKWSRLLDGEHPLQAVERRNYLAGFSLKKLYKFFKLTLSKWAINGSNNTE